MNTLYSLVLLLSLVSVALSFRPSVSRNSLVTHKSPIDTLPDPNKNGRTLQMNFFEDAARFFSNLNKEASAKHILIKGPGAATKLEAIKTELQSAENLSEAFSQLAAKVSECPSASRGGNLGTFKPGMMVKEFDRVVFEKEVGVVHGPVETQFGAHLILITRRFEGEEKK